MSGKRDCPKTLAGSHTFSIGERLYCGATDNREKIVTGLQDAISHAKGKDVGARVTHYAGKQVEDGCGCVFCDLDLKPESYVIGGVNMGDHHPNKHGRVIPCTRQQ